MLRRGAVAAGAAAARAVRARGGGSGGGARLADHPVRRSTATRVTALQGASAGAAARVLAGVRRSASLNCPTRRPHTPRLGLVSLRLTIVLGTTMARVEQANSHARRERACTPLNGSAVETLVTTVLQTLHDAYDDVAQVCSRGRVVSHHAAGRGRGRGFGCERCY